ncbi:MAG: NFACT RNA binding domain-containing protein, partial [Bacteroidota bacterium]
ITIKLDPQLNPQENAKRYYNKHKQRRARLLYLKEQMEDIENKLLNAEGEWEELQQLTPPDKLTLQDTGFGGEELKAMKQFSRQLRREMKEAEEEKSPFRHFRLAGYEIFVGKNARNNDELSFKYASKNDLWLHAKDVTGSHVIIRHRAGKDLPGEVLEYAAQLAAYYSKRKNDTLVPVQYTPRKYIRKRKGDPPGLVAVDREQVIMVEPVKA